MTKLFRDVDYFITHASNSTQREFELDFADVIEVYDTNETTLVTEDGKTLSIVWDELGYFKTYGLIFNEVKSAETSTILEQYDKIISSFQKQITILEEVNELKDQLIEAYKSKLQDVEDMLESTNTLLNTYRKFNSK
jgi:hypothetical protein